MSSEENFKKTLNDQLSAKEFSFVENDWQQAEKFIAASRRKRRMRPLLWIIPAAFIGGASFLFVGGESAKQVSSNQPVQTTVQEKTPTAIIHSDEKQVKQEVSSKVIEPEKSPVREAKPKQADKSVSQPVLTSEPTPVPAETKLFPSTLKGNDLTPTNQPAETKALVAIEPGKETIKENTEDTNPIDKPLAEPSKNNDAGEDVVQKTESIKTEVPAIAVIAAKAVSEENTQNTVAATESENKEVVPNTNSQDVSPSDSQTAAPIASAAAVAAALPDTDYVALQRPLLTVEAGANLARGWNSGDNTEAGGINPLVGINYFQNLGPKFAISAGFQYYSIGNLKSSTYTSRIVRYNLGEQSQVTVFTPTRLHYLSLPLQLNYRIGSANTVGVGVNIAYLLTVDVNTEQYMESIDGKSPPVTSKDRGYTQGFKKFDNQICLFYRRRFLTNAFIGAELYYGLAPVKDEFFNATGKEKNMGLKITLGYYLFKSK